MATSCGNKVIKDPSEKKISVLVSATDINITIALNSKVKDLAEGAEFVFIDLKIGMMFITMIITITTKTIIMQKKQSNQ